MLSALAHAAVGQFFDMPIEELESRNLLVRGRQRPGGGLLVTGREAAATRIVLAYPTLAPDRCLRVELAGWFLAGQANAESYKMKQPAAGYRYEVPRMSLLAIQTLKTVVAHERATLDY